MAAILKFRRGETVPSIVEAEPFFHVTDYTLNIGTDIGYITLANMTTENSGDFRITGTIYAQHGSFTGNVDLDGDLFIGGSITLGDGGTDIIFVGAPLSGSLIPTVASTYDLGSPLKPWRHIYADSATIGDILASSVEYANVLNKPTLVSGSSQITHNSTTGYEVNRHIDHSSLSITAGNGLTGGGILTASRTINLDGGSTYFITSVTDILDDLGVISGSSGYSDADTLSFINSQNVISGSSQIDHNLTTNYSSSRHFLQSEISITESQISDLTHTVIPDGTISGSEQLNGSTLSGMTISGSFSGSYVGDGSQLTGINNYTFVAGPGIIINEVSSSIEISGSIGSAVEEKLTSAGGETEFILSNLIDTQYKYQVFINGVLQQEGAGNDYTLTDTTVTTINFIVPLVATDFVHVYYNDTDVSGGGGTGLNNIVEDLTPQLGADLDAQNNRIWNVSEMSASLYYGDGSNLTGITTTLPSGLISGSSQLDGTTINSLTGSFTGSFVGDGSGLTGLIAESSKDLLAGPGIIINETTSSYEISGSVGDSIHEWLDVTGSVSEFPLQTLLSSNYRHQVFVNGILQVIGATKDYTLVDTSITTVNFILALTTNDFVDVYYNSIDSPFGASGDYYTDADNLVFLNSLNVLSGSVLEEMTISGSFSGSYIGDGSQLTGVGSDLPSGVISGSSQLDGTTINSLSGSFSGSFEGNVNTTYLLIQSGSISYQENLDVDTSTPRTIATVPTGSCDAVFFDYVVKNGGNYRAGTVMTVHDGSFTTYTDNSTSDIGDTSDVTLYTDLDTGNIRLMSLVLSDNWIIKTLIRTI